MTPEEKRKQHHRTALQAVRDFLETLGIRSPSKKGDRNAEIPHEEVPPLDRERGPHDEPYTLERVRALHGSYRLWGNIR